MYADHVAPFMFLSRWYTRLAALVAVFGLVLAGCGSIREGEVLSTLALGAIPRTPVIAGTTLYVIDENGLNVIDVQDPARPTLVSTLALPTSPARNSHVLRDHLAVSGTLVYLIMWLQHNDEQDDFTDGSVGQTWLDRGWLTLDDPTAPFSATVNVIVFDMADPVAPRHVAVLTEAQVGPVGGITIVDDLVVFSQQSPDHWSLRILEVFDLSNLVQPQKLGRITPDAHAFVLVPPYLYTTTTGLMLVELDSPPTEVSQLKDWSMDSNHLKKLSLEGNDLSLGPVAVSGQHAYVGALRDGGLFSGPTTYLITVALTDPVHPVEVSQSTRETPTDLWSDAIRTMAVTNQGLFLVFQNGRVERLSLEDPAHPTVVAQYQIEGSTVYDANGVVYPQDLDYVNNVVVAGDLIYVTGSYGLRIIRL